jgi:hypothetical protein
VNAAPRGPAGVASAEGLRWRIQVIVTDGTWRRNIVGIEAVLAQPRPGITAVTVSVEDLLCRRHDLVDGSAADVRRIGIASNLNSLHLC